MWHPRLEGLKLKQFYALPVVMVIDNNYLMQACENFKKKTGFNCSFALFTTFNS
jgi:hypothetical protein